ncbi:D-serine ammonia-lyase [Orrella sp. JC864]|uniref:D-serine ammonia-lyase n=1 Tax=Orrella sp. JC864 TaxID=3120298 RepID=UPI00300A5AE2
MNLASGIPAGLLQTLQSRQPTLWCNPAYETLPFPALPPDAGSPAQAQARLARHAPVLGRLFAELAQAGGRIASPLLPVPRLREALLPDGADAGAWFVKADHALPVAGSVKARGGFHEVLCLAERLLQEAAGPGGRLPALDEEAARTLFARHTVAVGSTGNLGLSIGLIARALGFRAVVHMSADAKQWKKDRLRARGIEVVEHGGDYARAVQAGREQARRDPHGYFVDDEHSAALFMGYAASAGELAAQLAQAGRPVDAEHPLFVYVPCGVGGAPGGITYGLKQHFGAHVHCFFAEPAASPCMLVQLASGGDAPLSVYDIGLDNRTEADGLAVGLASPLVAPLMRALAAGIFTVADERLFVDAVRLHDAHGVLVEPSAAAGFGGPGWLLRSQAGRAFVAGRGLEPALPRATHVLWSTGGSLVPAPEHERFQARGRALLQAGADAQ